MTDLLPAPRTDQPLTSRILLVLLRHRVASTQHLHELLDDDPPNPDELDRRLTTLHTQHLTACHRGTWHLTEEGLAVARAQPESLGLCPDQPITAPGPNGVHGQEALALTALGLAFRREHQAHYPATMFSWQTQITHHYKDGAGQPARMAATARLRTCMPGHRPLLALDALVHLLPPGPLPQTVGEVLVDAAQFEGGGPPGTTSAPGPWRRWYPRAPSQLLVARHDGDTHRFPDACREPSDSRPEVAGLLERGRIGLAVLADLERHGTEAAVWAAPRGGAGQVWRECAVGTGEESATPLPRRPTG